MTPLRCLLSYAFFRNTDLAELAAELRTLYGGPVEIFADSGAFSVASTGATVNLKDYAAWLREWSPVITTAATLDVIGDPDATQRNTEALLGAGLTVLPTFHVGTPWPVLERLCETYGYVALGGMVPFNGRPGEVMRWMIRAFRVAQEHGTVFHGFGQTNLRAVSSLPFYTVDSSTWAGGVRYGRTRLWDEQTPRMAWLDVGRPEEARRCAFLLRSHGADPEVVGRPGFAQSALRDPETYAAEYRLLCSTAMLAYHRFGKWLTRRHRVAPPAGWRSVGTGLFLACTDAKAARLAAQAAREPACSVS